MRSHSGTHGGSRTVDKASVLIVTKTMDPGGAESIIKELIRHTANPRVSITVAHLLPANPNFVADIDRRHISIVSLGRKLWLWPLRLAVLTWSGGFTVVHVHSPLPGAVARLAARLIPRSRRPFIVTTEHTSWDNLHKMTRLLSRLTIRLSDAVVTVSEAARLSMSPPAALDAVVLTHGTNVSKLHGESSDRASLRGRIGLAPTDAVITCAANLRPVKDHGTLLEAIRIVRDSGRICKVMLVGEGQERPFIEHRINELGLNDSVRMLGSRDDVPQIIAASNVLVLSSRIEGLPVVLMEAVAVGTPIVATAVGGIPEHFTDDVNALLVPPGDPEKLAIALTRVLDDPDLGPRLAASASRLIDIFDSRRSADFYQHLYLRAGRQD